MDLICSLEQCFTRHIHAKILNWGVNVLIDRFVCSSATNRVRKGYSRWLSLMFSFHCAGEIGERLARIDQFAFDRYMGRIKYVHFGNWCAQK